MLPAGQTVYSGSIRQHLAVGQAFCAVCLLLSLLLSGCDSAEQPEQVVQHPEATAQAAAEAASTAEATAEAHEAGGSTENADSAEAKPAPATPAEKVEEIGTELEEGPAELSDLPPLGEEMPDEELSFLAKETPQFETPEPNTEMMSVESADLKEQLSVAWQVLLPKLGYEQSPEKLEPSFRPAVKVEKSGEPQFFIMVGPAQQEYHPDSEEQIALYSRLKEQGIHLLVDLPPSDEETGKKPPRLEVYISKLADEKILEELTKLPHVYKLQAKFLENLTDAGLASISRLEELRVLDLTGNTISDFGVQELVKLKQLQKLSLSFTDITNESLAHLQQIPELWKIDIDGTRLSEERVKRIFKGHVDFDPFGYPADHLKELQHVIFRTMENEYTTGIRLRGPQVTDQSLLPLRALRGLQALALEQAKITGAGMRHLQRHGDLSLLVLKDMPFTDEDLLQVAKIPKLNWVVLDNTKVTPEGINEFRRQQQRIEVHLIQ